MTDVLSVRPAVECGLGGAGSGCGRQGISAQARLYHWGAVEFRAGWYSFVVTG